MARVIELTISPFKGKFAGKELAMIRDSIFRLPLTQVLRLEIALGLQKLYDLYTIGGFLLAWREPQNRRYLEAVFDSPEQAHNAVATFAAWLSVGLPPAALSVEAWWPSGPSGVLVQELGTPSAGNTTYS